MTLDSLIQKNLSYDDGTILKSDKKRIRYFALLVPVLIGNTFSKLLSQKLTWQNRKRLTLASAIIPLFDDYFEQKNLSITRLETLILSQKNFIPSNSKEKLLYAIYLELEPLLIDKSTFFELVKSVFDAQQIAQKQKVNSDLCFEELRKITFEKGGLSVVLFNSLIYIENNSLLNDVSYQTGGLIQYADDIFDLWFDWNDGIKTLANATSITEVEMDYKNQIEKLITLTNNLDVDSKQKRKFLKVQLFFLSRAFVAINQLKEITKAESGKFNPDKYTRQQLVCDMEKPVNIKSWIRQYHLIIEQHS